MSVPDWIRRGARVVITDPDRTYAGEHGVVLSTAKHTALVRIDGAEDVFVSLDHLKPEADG